MPAYLVRIGVTVFATLFAIAVITTEHQAAGRAFVAAASPAEAPVAIAAVFEMDRPVAVAGFQAMPPAVEAAAEIRTAYVVAPPAGPAVAVAAPAVAPAASSDSIILASWYGPGFYGNKTACGQVYTPQILGVAHLTLPCGTQLTLIYGGRAVTVPVIDRGPYIAGRTIDLSNATKLALSCTDLCTLRMQVLR